MVTCDAAKPPARTAARWPGLTVTVSDQFEGITKLALPVVAAVGVPSPTVTQQGWPDVAIRIWSVAGPNAPVACEVPEVVKTLDVPARLELCFDHSDILL
jgi:hypothetical protein